MRGGRSETEGKGRQRIMGRRKDRSEGKQVREEGHRWMADREEGRRGGEEQCERGEE